MYVYIYVYMIWLRDLITENEDDIDASTWDDWYEYLKWNEYDIPKDEIKKLKDKFNLNVVQYLKFLIKLSDNKDSVYIIYNKENETFDYIRDISQWIYDLDDDKIKNLTGYSVDKIYNPYIGCTLEDLELNPGKLYHYTTQEKWESIQHSGELRGSHGTGLTNRYSHGIFTSTDPEEHASGTYGDVCLELDIDAFKNENTLSKVNLQYEPDIEDYLLRDLIRSNLELNHLEISIDSSGGMSPYTIILGHNIRIKFIKQI